MRIGNVPTSVLNDTDNILFAEGEAPKKQLYSEMKKDIIGTQTLATTSQEVKGAINEVKALADSNTASLSENTQQIENINKYFGTNAKECGAIADGNSHKLNSKYSTLAEAQAVYSFITSLEQEIDYASIQKAINIAMTLNTNVYIPSGKYYLGNDGLIIDRSVNPNRVSLIGQGIGNTKLTYTGTSECIKLIGNSSAENDNYMAWQEISGLYIIGTSDKKTGSIGISLKCAAMIKLRDISFAFFDTALYINGVEHSKFEGLCIRWNRKGILATSSDMTTLTAPNNLTFYSCHISSNDIYGALFKYCTTVNFYGGDIENNGTTALQTYSKNNFGLKVENAGYQGGVALNLNNVYFESNAGVADVFLVNTAWETIDNSSIYSIIGCSFNRTSNDWYSAYNIGCTFASKDQCEQQKLSLINCSFKKFGNYTASADRKSVGFLDGISQDTDNYEHFGCIFVNDITQ